MRLRIMLLVIVMGGFPHCCFAEVPSRLVDLVRNARSTAARPSVPTDRQLQEAEWLFHEMVDGTLGLSELRPGWEALDFDLVKVEFPDGDAIWLVLEKSDRQSGRGAYALRRGKKNRLVLQAPHGFFDRHTREIVAHLAEAPQVAAASWNTVHRSNIDLAHVERHYFNAFTRAIVRGRRGLIVIQVHGFSKKDRRTEQGRVADFIVSNGSRAPTQTTALVARRIQAAFPKAFMRLYPWDVQELGATSNVQGRLVRGAGGEFVSIEVAPSLRQQLVSQARDREEFLKALRSAAE